MTDPVIVVSCAGRPFRPGMLFDIRNDVLIPGLSAFKGETEITEINNPDVVAEFRAATSFSDKTELLDLSAEVKGSFLGGLVKVSGSASYLDESRSHLQTETISFVYRVNTKFREVLLNKQENLNSGVLSNERITHIVGGVQYGGNAVFTFERSLKSLASNEQLQGNLSAEIKKVAIKVQGNASIDTKDFANSSMDDVTVRFVGDFTLPTVPTTFAEGLAAIKSIPGIIEGIEKPMLAYLIPVGFLEPTSLKLVRTVTEDLITRLGNFYQTLSDVLSATDSLLNSEFGSKLSTRNQEIAAFRTPVAAILSDLRALIADFLPRIRGQATGNVVEDTVELENQLGDKLRDLGNGITLDELFNWAASRELEEIQLETYVNVLIDITGTKNEPSTAEQDNQPDTGVENASDTAVSFGAIIPSFDKADVIRNLGENVGIPKLIVSIPTFIASPLLNRLKALINEENSDASSGGEERTLLESTSESTAQPIEDALFRVMRFVQANEEGSIKGLLTEGNIVGEGEEITVNVAVDDIGQRRVPFVVPIAPQNVEVNVDLNKITVLWKSPKFEAKAPVEEVEEDADGGEVPVAVDITKENAKRKVSKFKGDVSDEDEILNPDQFFDDDIDSYVVKLEFEDSSEQAENMPMELIVTPGPTFATFSDVPINKRLRVTLFGQTRVGKSPSFVRDGVVAVRPATSLTPSDWKFSFTGPLFIGTSGTVVYDISKDEVEFKYGGTIITNNVVFRFRTTATKDTQLTFSVKFSVSQVGSSLTGSLFFSALSIGGSFSQSTQTLQSSAGGTLESEKEFTAEVDPGQVLEFRAVHSASTSAGGTVRGSIKVKVTEENP